jgi:IS30 family transposase
MEFADWQSIERSCRTKGKRTKTFFCHPYCSCERGTNENINRMIRRWIPKGDDIGLYSSREISFIQNWINNYPRRIFNGKSSKELTAV